MKYTRLDNFLINCTQMFGSIWFGLILGEDIAADEATSAFVWRKQKTGWIKRVDRWFGKDHCKTSYEHSKAQLFDAPEYRA